MNINKLNNNITLLDVIDTTNNVVDKSNIISGGWVISHKTIYSYPTTLQWNNTNPTIYTIDLSNYLPKDGENYEVMYYCGGKGNVVLGSDLISDCGGWYGNVGNRIFTTTVVGNGRYLTVKVYNSNATEAELYLKAYKMVTSDVNTKLEQDLSNLTDEAKSVMAKTSFPSDTVIYLEWGTAGTSYTAPADGWFCARADLLNGYLELNNTKGFNFRTSGYISYGTTSVILPAKKNDSILLWYDKLDSTKAHTINFTYAVGTEHEYSN